MVSDKRLEKLPLWAREYIQTLQSDIVSLKHQLVQMDSESQEIFWELGLEGRHGIPDRAKVTMNGVQFRSQNNGWVNISCENGLRLTPVARNRIMIREDTKD